MRSHGKQSGIANVSIQQPIGATAWARPTFNKGYAGPAAARSMVCCSP